MATSVPSERKFNHAGNFHTKARFAMSCFTLQDLMYIRMHLPRVDQFASFMSDLATFCSESFRAMNMIIQEDKANDKDEVTA